MPSGLVALLDDVAAIAKLAAASLDDISGAAGKTGAKAAGVVIDDTAVTPRYVVGVTPDRELPIIGKIAVGSLRNKLIFLLPAALALSAFAPWAITPLLMTGGAYLCFEGTEKLADVLFGRNREAEEQDRMLHHAEIEGEMISGAIRTDLILSAEIMAIALADVAQRSLPAQAAVLAVVGVLVTIGVYGVVALIVKMDDIGLHLAERSAATVRRIGRALVRTMPVLLAALSAIGTAAMIWVGGGIIVHGLEHFHLTDIPKIIHGVADAASRAVPFAEGVAKWLAGAVGSGIFGLIAGAPIVAVVHRLKH